MFRLHDLFIGMEYSNALNSNQWVYDVSGILEHCVAVLKLCHTLTDKLAKIPLNSISPQLNDVICQATARVVPRFDDLLQSMAAPNVDVRLIEARVVALCCSCWSLVSPFYLMNPKYKEVFGQLINDMEGHQKCLQLAVEQATINATSGATSGNGRGENGTPPPASSSSSATNTVKTPVDQRKTVTNETSQPPAKATVGTKPTPSSQIISGSSQLPQAKTNQQHRTPPEQKRITSSVTQPITVSTSRTPPVSLHHQAQPPIIRNARSASVSLHPTTRDESRQELLDHEAPADPSA
uniref:Transmembrane protein 98 n=1 Tax=Panagrolaimus superbus TaxID=310955 RepID=A0A914Y601_9BILA